MIKKNIFKIPCLTSVLNEDENVGRSEDEDGVDEEDEDAGVWWDKEDDDAWHALTFLIFHLIAAH